MPLNIVPKQEGKQTWSEGIQNKADNSAKAVISCAWKYTGSEALYLYLKFAYWSVASNGRIGLRRIWQVTR